ncbi:hypothetical protein [Wenzhouxiangella limi]|uniref:Type II secretion system protein GspC N-terminal domain-containing protein n=1 Tax=Wenzhouxiangella limi TaxID=2707351 RepID=A0A845V417_9GAMM|nr:hypothetical protein [Wenzhouxiangella limi]NDY94971.1 hypothetical protein [Wenzhouxiangella limi]
MIDTRNNLLTTLLAGLIGLTILVGLALFMLLGRVNLERIAPEGETRVPRVAVASPEKGLEAFDEYGEIYRRPVFFSDRRLPVIAMAEVEEEPEIEEEIEEEEPIPDLNASVAGIIITPDMRMAMIRDQEADRTVLLREGMSLEGEQAAWKLDRIDSRLVQFVSVDGQSTGLELEINTRGLTRPTRTRSDAGEEPPAEQEQAEDPEQEEADAEALSRAEEIRRRVAERRAELRAEAERRAREQQDKQ